MNYHLVRSHSSKCPNVLQYFVCRIIKKRMLASVTAAWLVTRTHTGTQELLPETRKIWQTSHMQSIQHREQKEQSCVDRKKKTEQIQSCFLNHRGTFCSFGEKLHVTQQTQHSQIFLLGVSTRLCLETVTAMCRWRLPCLCLCPALRATITFCQCSHLMDPHLMVQFFQVAKSYISWTILG